MHDTATLFVVGLSHRASPVATREPFAVAAADRVAVSRHLLRHGGLAEVVLLSTCNRVEIYGVAPDGGVDARALLGLLHPSAASLQPEAVFHASGEAAARHLFSVASGLESLVLGETEITGQIKDAYETAREAGLTKRVLNRSFQKALETAKDVRTRTAIGRGATSVGSVVALLAHECFGDTLPDRRVLVLGAGKMAETCLLYFRKNGLRDLVVANRSLAHAHRIAELHGGRAVALDTFADELQRADIVVCSTGCPHVVLNRGDVERSMAARGGRPLVLVDIAVPRDVAPDVREVPGVRLVDMDGLEATVRRNMAHREEDMRAGHDLIAAACQALMEKLNPAFTGGAPMVEAPCASC